MSIKNQSIYFLLGLIFFIVDRLLKYLFLGHILSNSFLLTYVPNSGLAFGVPLAQTFIILFYIIIIITIIFLVNWFFQNYYQKKYLESFSIWFIILGALSNIIDRLKFGFVVDYIDLHFWPVFNLGDTMIVAGVVLILVKFLFLEKQKIINYK